MPLELQPKFVLQRRIVLKDRLALVPLMRFGAEPRLFRHRTAFVLLQVVPLLLSLLMVFLNLPSFQFPCFKEPLDKLMDSNCATIEAFLEKFGADPRRNAALIIPIKNSLLLILGVRHFESVIDRS